MLGNENCMSYTLVVEEMAYSLLNKIFHTKFPFNCESERVREKETEGCALALTMMMSREWHNHEMYMRVQRALSE